VARRAAGLLKDVPEAQLDRLEAALELPEPLGRQRGE
jgi:hypothetical protein